MHISSAVSASLLLLAGCQSAQPPAAQLEEPRERCDTVLTGSRLPQCNRGDVKIITREELERNGSLQGNPTPPSN